MQTCLLVQIVDRSPAGDFHKMVDIRGHFRVRTFCIFMIFPYFHVIFHPVIVLCRNHKIVQSLPSVQEVVTHLYSNLLYKMGHFLDIQYDKSYHFSFD